jgi:hypothetical protein
MSEETKMPAVGETWYSETYAKSWGELTVVELVNWKLRCRASGGTAVDAGETGVFPRSDLTRRIREAPEAIKVIEWKVGDYVEGNDGVANYRGTIRSLGHMYDDGECVKLNPNGYEVLVSTLRRLSAPPSVPEPVLTHPCCNCGASVTRQSNAAERGEMAICRPCKVGAIARKPVATPTPKADPYTAHQSRCSDADISELTASYEATQAKRRRFTADTLADFDRPLLKMGGRFGKVVPVTHPSSWPEADEGEP